MVRCPLDTDRNTRFRLLSSGIPLVDARMDETLTVLPSPDSPYSPQRGDTESAVLIACPAADEVVDSWRRRLDSSRPLGVPAHVTLLYPFVDPADLDDDVMLRLVALASRFRTFEFTLAEVRWFGDSVVCLAPEPVTPFRRLTDALVESFPGHVPYGGVHDEVHHHLTVGDGGTFSERRRAASALQLAVPICERAEHLDLMVGGDALDSWHVAAQFPLGERARPGSG
jgi:hypothetical protein